MKKNKLLTYLVLLGALVGLSSCSLFTDEDMSFENTYNPVTTAIEDDPDAVYACGVKAKTIEEVPDTLVFKSIGYAKDGVIENTYKTDGKNHNIYSINNNQDYSATKTSNNYDLYVPDSASRDNKHVVILFIHGGAWVTGLKTDVNPYIYEFAKLGYITATIKYTLLKRTMDDESLSIFRNLDEIDACIASIKEALTELGFDTTKSNLVIGGASSGAHLSMLYAYSRGKADSALPIRFVVDAVGPVNIKPDCWKRFSNASEAVLNAGITKSAIDAQRTAGNLGRLPIAGEEAFWNDYQTMRIANGMCGLPYTLAEVEAATDSNKENIVHPNAASNSMTQVGGGEDQLSVTSWISATNNYPIICAYAGKDSIVGINQYATLEAKLDEFGIEHPFYYFKDGNHTDISKEKDETNYNAFVSKIDQWCKAV